MRIPIGTSKSMGFILKIQRMLQSSQRYGQRYLDILLTHLYLLHTMLHLTFRVFVNLWSSMTLTLLILTIIVHFAQRVTIMTLDVIPLVIFVNNLRYQKVNITVLAMMQKCVHACFSVKLKMQDGVI